MTESLLATPVTLGILILTIFVSYRAFNDPATKGKFLYIPYRVAHDREYHRLYTAGFIHANWPHLIFNMWALYLFGGALEGGPLDSLSFLLLYMGSMLFANLPRLWVSKDDPTYAALGASGAVSGLVLSFIIFAPEARLGLLFIPVYFPGWAFGLVYLAISFFGSRRNWGNIDHGAHLWGAISGIALTVMLRPEAGRAFLNWVNTQFSTLL